MIDKFIKARILLDMAKTKTVNLQMEMYNEKDKPCEKYNHETKTWEKSIIKKHDITKDEWKKKKALAIANVWADYALKTLEVWANYSEEVKRLEQQKRKSYRKIYNDKQPIGGKEERMKGKYELEAFAYTVNNIDNRLPKSRGRCFDVGTWGGCGLRCPVFIEGECEEPQEMDIGEMEKEYNEDEIQEIAELYDCFNILKKGKLND
jgi:hypothetical protein